jgi:hypothetical protein
MTRFRMIPVWAAVALTVWGGTYPTNLAAQQSMPTMPGLPLRPLPPDGYFIIPAMEGWYDNGDGSITIAFGYLNRNEETVEIPIGENNFIEPAQFNGMQPTVFEPDHQASIFTVTVPAAMAGTDVWWTIRSAGEMTRVPGRRVIPGYEFDRRPLLNGQVAPLVSFEEGGETGQYPEGIMAERVERVRVGEPLTLTLHASDPSVRQDLTGRPPPDTITVNVAWAKHQGPPGELEWIRDPSTPPPPPPPQRGGVRPDSTAGAGAALPDPGGAALPDPGGAPAAPDDDEAPAPNEITLPFGGGTALQQVRFPVAGTYLLRARISNSDAGGVFTNAYVRVEVTE